MATSRTINCGVNAFVDGTKTINLKELGGDKTVFTQFLMEDGIAIGQLRQLNQDVANIGGVHEPRMPIVREIPQGNSTHPPKSSQD